MLSFKRLENLCANQTQFLGAFKADLDELLTLLKLFTRHALCECGVKIKLKKKKSEKKSFLNTV